MIHGFLFITNPKACYDQGGHGQEFQYIMNEINQFSGLKITIYHSFHDEVDHFRTHIWKCNGPCQHKAPYYGLVKRSMNRAPGPSDNWYQQHKNECGGEFIKISEPPKKNSTQQLKQIQTDGSQRPVTDYFNKKQSNQQPVNLQDSDEILSQNKLKRKELIQKNEILSHNFQKQKNYYIFDIATGMVLNEIKLKQMFKDFSKDHLIMEFQENSNLILQISVSGSFSFHNLLQLLQTISQKPLKLYLDDSRVIPISNDVLNKTILHFYQELMVTDFYLQNVIHQICLLKYDEEIFKSKKIICIYYNHQNSMFNKNLNNDEINYLLNKT